MDSPSSIYWFIRALLEQLPSLITIAVCLILVIRRWKRHPRVSLLAAVTLGLLLFHGPVFSVIYVWVSPLFLRSFGTESFRTVQTVIGTIYFATLATFLSPLLAAIFAQRRSRI